MLDRRAFFTCALVSWGAAGFAATAVRAGEAAKQPSDWKIMGAGTEVKTGTLYTLRNITDNNSVKYGERTWGINLVWDKSQSLNNVKFEVKPAQSKGGAVVRDNRTLVLKNGDTVAINVKGGGYLRHENRSVGINLGWSKNPVHEFIIVGGLKGTPVKMGTPLGLFNVKAKDFVIYAERPAGVSLRWWKDRDLAGPLWERVARAAGDYSDFQIPELIDYLTPAKKK